MNINRSTSDFLLLKKVQFNNFIHKRMKTSGIGFHRFREDKRTKVGNLQHFKSPTPTSFRQISESRQKNKLMSGKKSAFNKGINMKCTKSPISSGKKQANLFSQLLSSRTPSSIKKNPLPFDQSGQTTNNSGISFNAFKTVSFKDENQNNQNKDSVDIKKVNVKGKGLQFKNFPHKKANLNTCKKVLARSPSRLLNQGSLIKKSSKSTLLETSRSPLKGFSRHNSEIENKQVQKIAFRQSLMSETSVNRSGCDQTIQFDMSPLIPI